MKQFDLLQRIRRLNRLTPSETKIADFFQRSHKHLAFETVTSISEKTHVSKATVVRFIARLGVNGFADFQERLRKDMLRRLETPVEKYAAYRSKYAGGPQDYLGQSIGQAAANFEETHAAIPPDLLLEAARVLAFAPGRVYIMGQLTSFGQAHFFWTSAVYLRPDVRLLDNGQMTLPYHLSDVTSGDVLLAITRSRYTRQTVTVVKQFAKIGAKVLLITDDNNSPAAPFADIRLEVPIKGAFIFISPCAIAAVLDALLWAMADLIGDRLPRRLETLDLLHSEMETFMPSKDRSHKRSSRSRKQERRPE